MDLFDPHLAWSALGALLLGLKITVELTLLSGVISLVAGVPVALLRMSRFRVLRLVTSAYVQVIRATPLLVQLIYIYYALPLIGIRLSPFTAAVIGLSLHIVPYLSEVYRSGIQAIPQGQRDAAVALGMRPATVFMRVVLPQAIRIVIPVLGNYMVSLFKDTSLASVLTVQELLFSGQIIGARTFDYFTMYTMVFLGYLIVGYPAIKVVDWIEHRAARGFAKHRGGKRLPHIDLAELEKMT